MSSSSQPTELNTESSYYSTCSADCERDQEEIIAAAKEIEQYLQINNKEKKSTSHKILCTLFDLFRSELATNISLRNAILRLRQRGEAASDINTQLSELFAVVQEYDPSIKTLDDVFDAFGDGFSATKREKAISCLKESKEVQNPICSELEKLKKRHAELEALLSSESEEKERSVSEQQIIAQKAEEEEQQLATRMKECEEEHEMLLEQFESMTGKNSIERMNQSLGEIDGQIDNVSKKMQELDSRHVKKVESLHEQIDSLSFEIEELKETKEQIEEQLDQTHKQISDLQDEMTLCSDVDHNPFAARRKHKELKSELSKLVKELNSVSTFNEEFINNIALLRTEAAANEESIKSNDALLSDLEKELEDKKESLKSMMIDDDDINGELSVIKDLEITKTHVAKENARLTKSLSDARKHYNTLKLENQSLQNSLQIYSSEIENYSTELEEEPPLSEEEISAFAEVSDAFRYIREQLHMSPDSTPEEITNFVLKSVSLL